MRKIIQYTMLGLMLCSLLALNSCVRSDVTDPDMHANAGFLINLSGVANPGTLFVTQGGGWQNSYITMNAKFNDGTPVVGRNILMKIGEEFGTFPGDKRTAVITTNSQGTASIRYSISQLAIDQIGPEKLVYIQAWMQGDLINVYDLIPIQLVTNMPDAEVNTFMAVPTDNRSISAATGGSFNVFLYNSTGTESITYLINITDADGIISSHTDGDTGSTGTAGNTETFEIVDTGTSGQSATITITAVTPSDVAGTTYTITVTLI